MVFDIVGRELAKADKFDYLRGVKGYLSSDAFDETKLSESVYNYITSLGVASAAEMTFAQKCALVKIALKEQAVAFFTSPLGMATAVVAGIYLIVKAVDLFGESLDESREQLAGLKEEYKTNEQELTSLNSELETTGSRINELNGKEKLSFTEEEELSRLQAQNAELQRSIDLLELEQKLKQKEVNREFVDTMHKHRGTTDWNEAGIYDGTLETNLYKYEYYNEELTKLEAQYQADLADAMSEGDDEQAKKIQEKYEKRKAQIESNISSAYKYLSEKNSEFMVDMEGVSYTPDAAVNSIEAQTNAALDYIGNFQDRMAIAAGGDNAITNALNRLTTQTFAKTTEGLQELGKEGKVTAEMLQDEAYSEFINTCLEIGIISEISSGSLAFLATYFNTVGTAASNSASGLANTSLTLESVNEKIDSVQSRISTLSDAFTKLNDGTMTIEEVIDLIQEFPELAEYVDLTAENFGDLDKGLVSLMRHTPDDLIEQLQKFKETEDLTEKQKDAIDALCKSLENMSTDAIKDASGEFGVLAEAINGAKKAKDELDKALSEEDYDTGYEGRVEAFTGLQEVLKNGEVGSKAFAAYKEYFGLMGQNSDQVKDWVNGNKKYFTEGTNGVKEFVKTVEKLNKSGVLSTDIASYDSKTNEFRYDINQLEAFADALGWSEEMLQDFIYKYRMYCEEWTSRTTELTRQEFFNEGLILKLEDGQAIASLDELMNYTNKSKEEVLALVREINQLNKIEGLPEIQLIGADQITISQQYIDSLAATKQSVEDVKSAIVELSQVDGVTFEAGIEYNGQTVEEILAEASGDGTEIVSVDVKMNINDEEILTTVTTTAGQIKAILGDNWEAVITGDTVDADEKIANTKKLLEGLPPNTPVTVDGYTEQAESGLTDVKNLLADVSANSYQKITIEYETIGDPPQYATGTRSAPEGPALLGDEYSPDGSPKPEMVISDGHAYVAGQDGPELVHLNSGDQVLTYDQTRKVLRGNPQVRKSIIPAFATGAGGYEAGSVEEDKYLEGLIGPKSSELAKKALKRHEASKKAATTYTTSNSQAYADAKNEQIAHKKYNATTGDAGGVDNLDKVQNSNRGSSSSSGGSSSSYTSSEISNEKTQFEKDYEYHQHLLAMEQEDQESYIKWLEKAYKEAYAKGELELEDLYQYEEEIFNARKELFQDGLKDIEHQISELERGEGNESKIIAKYQTLISKVEAEIAAARGRGLNDDDEYIQELLQQKWDYADEIADIQEEITENAKDAVDDLVDYRIDMLKQDLENEKDALSDKMSALKDFYDEQKQMLQDVRDEEKYLEEQSEKRKSVDDIRAEMDMLRFDDSAKSQKRLLELQEELREAEKELSDFEKDHALESTTDLLDKMYEQQESQIQSEIDELDARLNDPEALYNQALRDIQNNTLALYEEMVRYNAKYGSGNSQDITDMWNAADESLDAYLRTYGQAYKGIILSNLTSESTNGPKVPEVTPGVEGSTDADTSNDQNVITTPNGDKYHLLENLGDIFFNSNIPDFWKNMAGASEQFMSNLFGGLVGNLGNIGRVNQPTQITTGDIVIQGNADSKTVSEIRRAQRDNVDHILREFIKLNK